MKIKTRHAQVKYHKFVEHEDGTITKEVGVFPVYGQRLSDGGCRRKTPDGCIYDGMEIVTETYEVDESIIRQYGVLIPDEEEN